MTLVSGSPGTGKSTLGMQFVLEAARTGEHSLYISLEEGPAQILLRVVEDKVSSLRPARVVLDSASDIEVRGLVSEELRLLLYGLVIRPRGMGVTSLFTLEARSLFVADLISERGLSPLADNILMLRYAQEEGRLVPNLTVVKTRGSSHDRATHRFSIGEGGLLLPGGQPEAASPPSRKHPPKAPAKRRRRARGPHPGGGPVEEGSPSNWHAGEVTDTQLIQAADRADATYAWLVGVKEVEPQGEAVARLVTARGGTIALRPGRWMGWYASR